MYCGLIDARMNTSDKVHTYYCTNTLCVFFHISVSFFLTKLTSKLVLKKKSFCKLNQILCMKITYPKMNHNALVTSNVKYFLLENLSDKKQNVVC